MYWSLVGLGAGADSMIVEVGDAGSLVMVEVKVCVIMTLATREGRSVRRGIGRSVSGINMAERWGTINNRCLIQTLKG